MSPPDDSLAAEIAAHVRDFKIGPDGIIETTREELGDLALVLYNRGRRDVLKAYHGRETGNAVDLVLRGQADRANTVLAPGVSRSNFSRIVCKLLRGFGRPIENPAKARAGHSKGWKARAVAKNGTRPEAQAPGAVE